MRYVVEFSEVYCRVYGLKLFFFYDNASGSIRDVISNHLSAIDHLSPAESGQILGGPGA